MEGPIGRYARASEDYTGTTSVAHVLRSVRSEHHLGQRTLSAQTGRTSDSKRSGRKSATILTSGGPSTSAMSNPRRAVARARSGALIESVRLLGHPRFREERLSLVGGDSLRWSSIDEIHTYSCRPGRSRWYRIHNCNGIGNASCSAGTIQQRRER
jgi:hypothetical protein